MKNVLVVISIFSFCSIGFTETKSVYHCYDKDFDTVLRFTVDSSNESTIKIAGPSLSMDVSSKPKNDLLKVIDFEGQTTVQGLTSDSQLASFVQIRLKSLENHPVMNLDIDPMPISFDSKLLVVSHENLIQEIPMTCLSLKFEVN